VHDLTERVRQLERQADLASARAEAAERYESSAPPPLDLRCNGKWVDCWWYRNQPFYGESTLYGPTFGTVVVPSHGFRDFRRFHGMRRFPQGGAHRR
jgi:hypothetical protein